MKRRVVFLLFLSVVLVMALATTRLAAAPKVLKLAEVHPKGYPTELADEEFARLVEEKTDGALKIQVCFGGQLGSENDVVEQAKLGVIEFVRVSTSPVVSVYPPIGVFSMPYIFRSQEHMWKVLNGSIGQHFLDSLTAVGLVGIAYFDAGARSFYATKPLRGLADLKGLKIRVQPNPIMVNLVKLLGATPVPIAYGEVYSALQTGVIDGAENNIPSWISAGHYEVAKYYLDDGHLRLPELLMVSKKFWDSLPEEHKVAIKEAAKEATEFQIKAWNKAEADYLAQAKAKGCVITKANIAEFQAAVAPLFEMPEYAGYKVWLNKIKAIK
ncbi:MAG: TRAP transporter substrate-binding protein [Bacillota bacterium]